LMPLEEKRIEREHRRGTGGDEGMSFAVLRGGIERINCWKQGGKGGEQGVVRWIGREGGIWI